jgi:hypothetical protein
MSTDTVEQAPRRRRGRRGMITVGVGVALALALAAGVLATAWARDPGVEHYVPATRLVAGPEVVFIFVGGSFCLAHRREGFPQAVEKAKVELARSTLARRGHFRAVGVALDWDPDEGGRFLRKFGRFDEVSLGSNWVNGTVLRYVWRDMPGRPAVPQVVVVERQVEKSDVAINVVNEHVVRRLLGVDEIQDWAKAGAPLQGPFPRSTRGPLHLIVPRQSTPAARGRPVFPVTPAPSPAPPAARS